MLGDRRRLSVGIVLAAALALGNAGCGSSDGDDDATSATTGPAATSTAATTAGGAGSTAADRLAALYDGSTFGQPPKVSPAAQAGKKVWVIDLGLGSPGGVAWANGAKEAGKALGWDVTVFDGEFTPSRYLDGIRQAIAAKADGIVLVSVDCAPVKAALQQARDAGIKVSVLESVDCSDQDPSQPSLFDATVGYQVDGKPAGFLEQMRKLGAAQADWVTETTAGKGKVIAFKNTDSFVNTIVYDGFVAELRSVCPDCEIVETIEFVQADLLGSALRQRIEQSIIKNPTANAMVVPYDDVLTNGGAAGVVSSGRSDDLAVVAGTGGAAAADLIRDDKGIDATYALALPWESYAAMDNLNRLFAGEKPAPSGIGLGMIDREHGLPPSGQDYDPPVDFRNAYEQAWAAGT